MTLDVMSASKRYALTGPFVVLTALLLVVPSAAATSLTFHRTWGGASDDDARGVSIATDGSVYVAGVTASFGAGRTDAFLLKLTPGGSLLWQRTWGGNNVDEATAVAVAPDGSVYVAGTTTSFGPGNPAFLLKFSPRGDLVWQRTWGGGNVEFANGVAVAGDGSIYVAGQSVSFGSVRSAFLVKFSSNGDLVWQRIWDGPTREGASAVSVAGDGSVYVVGQTGSFSSLTTIFLLKFSSSGNLVWQELWSRNTNDFATGLAVAGDGSIYVTGIILGGSDLVLLKFTPDGSLIWQRNWNGIGSDVAQGITVLTDGSVVVAGWTDSFGSGLRDELVLRFSPAGNLIAQKTWGGASSEEAHGVAGRGTTVVVAGLTFGPPPYRLRSASGVTAIPAGSVTVPSGTLSTPSGTVGTPNGIVTTPDGSSSFAGGSDATILGIKP